MPALAEALFIFSAGALTLASPCAFPLLPGYIGYLIGEERSTDKVITAGVVSTLGLLTALLGLGLVVALFGSLISSLLPFIELGVAVLIIAFGVLMVADVQLPTASLPFEIGDRSGVSGVFVFGVGYGLAVSGCTAPIFFSVITLTLLQGFADTIFSFLIYGLGMGMVFVAVTLLVSEVKEAVRAGFGRVTFWLHKIGGIGLIGAGVYLLWLLHQARYF